MGGGEGEGREQGEGEVKKKVADMLIRATQSLTFRLLPHTAVSTPVVSHICRPHTCCPHLLPHTCVLKGCQQCLLLQQCL